MKEVKFMREYHGKAKDKRTLTLTFYDSLEGIAVDTEGIMVSDLMNGICALVDATADISGDSYDEIVSDVLLVLAVHKAKEKLDM